MIIHVCLLLLVQYIRCQVKMKPRNKFQRFTVFFLCDFAVIYALYFCCCLSILCLEKFAVFKTMQGRYELLTESSKDQ